MRWIAVVALVAGCDGASPSSQLDQTSGDSAGIVWVDADGDEVPGIVQLDQLAYVDDAGDIWTLDPWGERPEEAFVAFTTPGILYASDDCSTDPWITNRIPAPRFVASIQLQGRRAGTSGTYAPPNLSGPFFVVPDDAQIDSQADAYWDGGGGCAFDGVLTGIPVNDLDEVSRPRIDWLPPVHPEFR